MLPLSELAIKWRKWRDWEAWERRFVISMLIKLPLIWLGLHSLGFNRLLKIARYDLPWSFPEKKPSLTISQAERCAELTKTSASYCLPEGSCLSQALALHRYLKKRGLEPTLRIGMKPGTGSRPAHAWIELKGRPLLNNGFQGQPSCLVWTFE